MMVGSTVRVLSPSWVQHIWDTQAHERVHIWSELPLYLLLEVVYLDRFIGHSSEDNRSASLNRTFRACHRWSLEAVSFSPPSIPFLSRSVDFSLPGGFRLQDIGLRVEIANTCVCDCHILFKIDRRNSTRRNCTPNGYIFSVVFFAAADDFVPTTQENNRSTEE